MHIQFTFIPTSHNGAHIDIVPDHNRHMHGIYTVHRRTGLFSSKSDSTVRKHVLGISHDVGDASVKSKRVICNGQTIPMHKSGIFTKSETFVASDGKKYKWKVKGTRSAHLQEDNWSKHTIASYTAEHGFFYREPARLSVHSQGSTMLDEVVVTAVYISRKMTIKKSSNASASAVAASAS